MNIQLQICGILMLLLLLVFYKSHKTLGFYSESVFFRTLTVTLETVLFDTFSVVCIYYSDSLPLHFVKAICRIYLAFLVWSAWGLLTYFLLDFSQKSFQRRVTAILGAVCVIENIIMIFLPLEIFNDGKAIYTLGPAVITTYMVCAVFVFASLIISVVLSIKNHSRRAYGGTLLSIIWAGAAVVQYFNNELLLVGFAQCLSMLILFVLMENPESYIDREYSSFNVFGLKPFLNKLYESGQPFHVAQAFIINDDILADAGHNVDDIIRRFMQKVSHHSNTYVFKDTACSMTVITTSEESFAKSIKSIVETKHAAPYLKGYSKLVSLKNAEQLSGYTNFVDVFAYAKSTYINKTTEHVDINEEIINSHKKENDVIKEIDDAIAEDRVEVFMQPIFSNKEKHFTSAEALTRIRLKDGSLLSPGIFIPIAEKTGQIVSLGYEILEKVLKFISSDEFREFGLHYIEVNLSVMQCEQEDLFENIVAMMKKYDVDTSAINFEITESATISTKEIISANIQKLFEAGFSLSLDDFGKGESNLMYVIDIPVSLMKFDIDMTKAYFDSYKAKSVMRAIIPMAHGLDLKLVAEGVETARELELLSGEGIDYIQGYYYSKPLPIPEFIEFLRSHQHNKDTQSEPAKAHI